MHRSSVPRPLQRHPDPAQSSDPAIRDLIAELADLRIAAPADPRFRAELRTQLVAITPRLVEEQLEQDVADPPAPGSRAARAAGAFGARHTDDRVARRGARWRRPLAATVSVLAVLGILLGITVWMSRDAIPGDALYGLKRTSERVQLYFASSDTDRAKDYLQFAQRRADEVRSLLHTDQANAFGAGPTAAGVSAGTTKLISQTLDTADSQTESAMRLLGGLAARKKSAAPLDPMKIWAPPQYTRLRDLVTTAPSAAIRDRVDRSVRVLETVWARTVALDGTASCTCSGSAGSDRLGPRPCAPCGTPSTPGATTGSAAPTSTTAPGASSGSRTANSAGGSRAGSSGATSGTRGGAAPVSSSPGGASRPAGGGAPKSSQAGSSSHRLPSLPLPSRPVPSLPVPSLTVPSLTVPRVPVPSVTATVPGAGAGVGAGSCTVTVDGGPLHVGVTVCPSSSRR